LDLDLDLDLTQQQQMGRMKNVFIVPPPLKSILHYY
jgi:hypothetical protein